MSNFSIYGGVLLLALAIGVGVGFALSLQKSQAGSLRFSQKQFLTPNELEFYRRLSTAVGDKFLIMCQVSMGALIDNGLRPTHPRYWEARLKFSSKICDYVLCDKKSLSPVLVVELDDVTHNRDKDRNRDNFLALSGLRTVRFWSRNKPSPSHIREFIELELYKLAKTPHSGVRQAWQPPEIAL